MDEKAESHLNRLWDKGTGTCPSMYGLKFKTFLTNPTKKHANSGYQFIPSLRVF